MLLIVAISLNLSIDYACGGVWNSKADKILKLKYMGKFITNSNTWANSRATDQGQD